MAITSLGPRLTNKLTLSCHKNAIQNVLIDWLVNGSVDEKNDANTIIANIDEALDLVNGLNHQINPTFNKCDFFKELNSMIEKLLTNNEDYANKSTRNRKNIEVRGWLLTMYAQTLCDKTHTSGLSILKGFLSDQCDRKITIYWTLVAILYYLKHFSDEDKREFVNSQFSKIAIDNHSNLNHDRIYWLLVIWYINNDDNKGETESKRNLNNIVELLNKPEAERDTKINERITELFVALSCKPCINVIKAIQTFVEDVIDKDLNSFWEERDIHMYKYLILCLRNFGRKEWKKSIGDEQVNLYYKIFKLLNIARNYSSRIWNEIKLQLLKSLRIYNRTTGKRIVDELKDELLDSDISIVFEACKTLKSIFEIENCLKVIIDVLYSQSVKNVYFADKKVFAISYSLKILSQKETNLVNILQELEQGYDDYDKKNIIRKLFTEMGGMQAIRKSQQNADIREKYMKMTSTAQLKVEEMFHRSIDDAKKAFKISLGMNIIVFLVGIVLLATSGIMAIMQDTGDNWAGVGVSSGTGFLSVVYSLFINKPSRKIRKNTNHLMRLKVIFLGYLRELTQMDQTFSKNLLDNDNISQDTLNGYVNKIKDSMNNSLKALRWEEKLNIVDAKKNINIFGSDSNEDPNNDASSGEGDKSGAQDQSNPTPAQTTAPTPKPDTLQNPKESGSASETESIPEQALPNNTINETTLDNKVEEMRKMIMESVNQQIKMSINPKNSDAQQSLV